MSYTIKKLPAESIIVFRLAHDFAVQAELGPAARDMLALLNSVEEPNFLICDLSEQTAFNMEDMLVGTDTAARGESSPLHHPKIRQAIFVTRNTALKLATNGLGNDVYGNLFVPVFENYEDALDYARSQLGQ